MQKEKNNIIKILGAGISGLTAAINLAKAGYKVEVYERNKDCGMRFHGDFQGLENWSTEQNVLKELNKMNIKTNFWKWPSKRMSLVCGENNKVHKTSKKIIFYWVKRGCFKDSIDLNLKNQAIKSGVNILFNSKKNENEVDIIAIGPRKAGAIVKGISFDTKHKNTFIAQFDDSSSYKAYSYMLIINGHGTIVTGSINKGININKQFKKAKKYFFKHFELKLKNIKEWGNFANFSVNGPYKSKGKLFVGESAGLQDSLFGFGMRSAFVSGYLAAKSIIEKKNYQKLIKKRYSDYLKNSVVNRYFWERMGNKGYSYFINFLKLPVDGFYFLKSIYKYTFLKKLAYPFAYKKMKKFSHINNSRKYAKPPQQKPL